MPETDTRPATAQGDPWDSVDGAAAPRRPGAEPGLLLKQVAAAVTEG